MRYPQTKEQSNELLRLALPLIAKYGSGCHPPSYTLWYEYVDAGNPALRSALDARIAQRMPLTADETLALYGKFIAERDIAATEALQASLQRTLDTLARMATSAGNDAARYGESLRSCGDRLDTPLDVDALRGVIAALAAETRRIQLSNAQLSQELESSRRELLDTSAKLAAVRGEALQDPLTGLTNRRGFQKTIDETLTREGGLAGWTLLMVDIDHFKKVNDTHGHVLGDKVLQGVARILSACIRSEDVAIRLGGEEFAVLLRDTPQAAAVTMAERIRQNVARGRTRRTDQGEVSVTVSIGVAYYRPAESLEQWVSRADKALYECKQQGRDRVTAAA